MNWAVMNTEISDENEVLMNEEPEVLNEETEENTELDGDENTVDDTVQETETSTGWFNGLQTWEQVTFIAGVAIVAALVVGLIAHVFNRRRHVSYRRRYRR